MSKIIAVAGKGGTGKTTFAALLIGRLLKQGLRPVLAVDADADSNLPDALGMSRRFSLSSVGKAREDFFQAKGAVPPGIPKESYLELKLNEVLVESKDIDLLIMGRPEGAGCYCFINNILRKYLETLSGNYPFVVIDNEAGLEHLSRRTTNAVDYLFIVSDYSLNGLRAAARIQALVSELQLKIGRLVLVINRAPKDPSEEFMGELNSLKLETIIFIDYDFLLPQFEIERRPILDLPEDSAAVAAVRQCAENLF